MRTAVASDARTPAEGEVLNPDDWKDGLRFGRKALNTKTVARAGSPGEVLRVCFQHNLRKAHVAHRCRSKIDPKRTPLNTVLRGADDPCVGALLARNVLEELDLKPARTDAIMGIEWVFQPPPGWDTPQFYDECLGFLSSRVEFIVSAVVHRDQKRPHMHVLALAVADGHLAGAAMTSGANRFEAQRIGFMAHMRETLGLRPDRKAKTLADYATSPGKGPKSGAAAAKRDAEFERATGAGIGNLTAHRPHGPSDLMAHRDISDLMAPTSILRRLATISALFDAGVSAGLFPRTPTRAPTQPPAPPPQATPAVVILPAADAARAGPAAASHPISFRTGRPWIVPKGIAPAA